MFICTVYRYASICASDGCMYRFAGRQNENALFATHYKSLNSPFCGLCRARCAKLHILQWRMRLQHIYVYRLCFACAQCFAIKHGIYSEI